MRIDGEPVRGQSALGRAAWRVVADPTDGSPLSSRVRADGGAFSIGSCSASTPPTARASRPMTRRCASVRGCCATALPTRPGLPRWKSHGRTGCRRRSRPARGGAAARPRLRRGRRPFPRARLTSSARSRIGSKRCRRWPPKTSSPRPSPPTGRATRRPAAPSSVRIAPISRVSLAEQRIAGRARLDRRAEGLADLDPARRMRGCSGRFAASRRCCCSTRSPPISMRAGAPRCSRPCCGSTARPG